MMQAESRSQNHENEHDLYIGQGEARQEIQEEVTSCWKGNYNLLQNCNSSTLSLLKEDYSMNVTYRTDCTCNPSVVINS
jgi:hypothetical protein